MLGLPNRHNRIHQAARFVLFLATCLALLLSVKIVTDARTRSSIVIPVSQEPVGINQPIQDGKPDLNYNWNDEVKAARDIIKERTFVDSTGQYKVVRYALPATRYIEYIPKEESERKAYADITLSTQSSLSNLYYLIEMTRRWGGPISLSIFHDEDDITEAIQDIVSLRYCYAVIRERVSFHVIYPRNVSSNIGPITKLKPCLNFADPDIEFQHQYADNSTVRNYVSRLPYPNNMVRNEARKASFTEYVLLVDIDLIPSEDLRRQFLHVARQEKLFGRKGEHKEVYVLPTYELKKGMPLPSTRSDLMAKVRKYIARPFHIQTCINCHRYTNYSEWEKRSAEAEEMRILYPVEWKVPYEPFFICRNDAPMYREQFKQFGYNRVSQACEMFTAGFQLKVLSNGFLIHRGFKEKGGFHPTRDAELVRNTVLYNRMINELKEQYPNATSRCFKL